MAIFFFLLVIAASACQAQDAGGVPGVFTGTSVRVIERMGDPVLEAGEIAECILSGDGHFRLAALKPDRSLLWTRGSWSVDMCDAEGTELAFRCDDVSGILTGRREGDELFLKFSPKALETMGFRMKLRAPAATPGDGWSVHTEKPASGGPFPGIYLGTLIASQHAESAESGAIGSALLVLGPSGDIAGSVLAPEPGSADSRPVLCPVSGTWRLDGVGLLIRPVWGRPGPPKPWRNMGIQMSIESGKTLLEGQTSLDGMPADGCRMEKIAGWPDIARLPSGATALSCAGAIAQTDGGAFRVEELFPMRLSADRRFLYVRSSDDARAWLPFPIALLPSGEIRVNDDGRCGYLVRRADGGAEAFVLKTSFPAKGGAAAFLSRSVGPLWLLGLDIHRNPLKSGQTASFRRICAGGVLEPEGRP